MITQLLAWLEKWPDPRQGYWGWAVVVILWAVVIVELIWLQ